MNKLYKQKDLNKIYETLVLLRKQRDEIAKVSLEKYGVHLAPLQKHYHGLMQRHFDAEPISLNAANFEVDGMLNLPHYLESVQARFSRYICTHYRSVTIPSLANALLDYDFRSPIQAKLLSVSDFDSDIPSFNVDAKGNSLYYFDKESVIHYEIITSYLYTLLYIGSIRNMLSSIENYVHKEKEKERKSNRSLQAMREKVEERIKEMMPGGNSRWSTDFHPLVEGGKSGGWGTGGTQPIVMPKGFKPMPVGMSLSHLAFRTSGNTIPFMTSRDQLDTLASIFKGNLVVNVADNKRGLVTYVHGEIEDEVAAGEGIKLYEVDTSYYRNFQEVFRFIGDTAYSTINLDGDCQFSASKTIAKNRPQFSKMDRYHYEFPMLFNVNSTTQCIRPFLISDPVIVQEGASVVPGFNLKVESATNDNPAEGRLPYHANLKMTTERVSDNEWDIDQSKDCVFRVASGAMFKNRKVVRQSSPVYSVKGVPTLEKRYIAEWTSDTGHKEVVSGTSPKRALANIRRRIRNEIVDSLDIF